MFLKGILHENYSSTELVFVGEILKLFVSGYLTLTDRSETGIYTTKINRNNLTISFIYLLRFVFKDINYINLYIINILYIYFYYKPLQYIYCIYIDAQGNGWRKLFWLLWNSQKIIILVILYASSNLLSYYALARVDASAYTVLLQVSSYYYI